MTADRPRVSLIAVTYNSEPLVVDALQSARVAAERARVALEVIVVDNASKDASVDVVREYDPAARIIVNEVNVGFGRATNQGMQVASGTHLLLLNPDARLDPMALDTLLSQMSALHAGGVAPSIGDVGAESAGMAPSVASAAGHFLALNRLLPDDRGGGWRGFQLRRTPGPPRRVEWASAAALLLSSAAIREVGGFDERFFLYGEDVDLGIRMTEAGYAIWLVPAARAEHAIAASQGGVSTAWVDAIHELHVRSSGRLSHVVFDAIVSLGLSVRAAVAHIGPERSRSLHAVRMRRAARRAWGLLLKSHTTGTATGRE